jgi:hypothetical protein
MFPLTTGEGILSAITPVSGYVEVLLYACVSK